MSDRWATDRGSIYLSGGMEHSSDGGVGWRESTSAILRSMGYFPIDIAKLDADYTEQCGQAFPEQTDHLSEARKKAVFREHFVHADVQLIINDSDALIVYYDRSVQKGAGTISECQVAFMYEIPIFIVSDWEDWQTHVPDWLHALSTKVFTTFDDLYQYLERLPYGVFKRDDYGNHRSGDYYLCSLTGEPFQKSKTHFVSKVSPLYNNESVEIVKQTHEEMHNRYDFFRKVIDQEKKD